MSIQSIFTTIISHIDNKLGLYALIGLFLLFLIYLIRPKSLKMTIPSLIFLMKDTGKSKKESFFEKLLRDFLLIFHFLLIAILAVSAMQPFYFSDKDVNKEHTVLVLDTSASMLAHQESFGADNLFEQMKKEAKGYLGGKTSIVIVDNEPLVALKEGKEEEAVDIIDSLKPQSSLSTIGNSILAAGDLLAGEKGRVVVISDFISTDSVEPIIAKKTLEAKGVHVEFIGLNDGIKNNIGIVNAEFTEAESKVTIQNFNDRSVQFDFDINGEKQSLALMPNANKKISFKNKEGDNVVKLLIKDDLEIDNEIHIYTPVKKKLKVLFISNSKDSFIPAVLNAYKSSWNSEIEIDIAEPPKMPPIDHDLIIIGQVDKGKLVKGSIDQIDRLVNKKGYSLIITAFEGLNLMGLNDIMPVKIVGISEKPTEVFNLQTINEITNDISFAKTDRYFFVDLKEDAIPLANSKDNSTLIAIKERGNGYIAYYGIFDSNSKFKFDISYPLFWQQLIDYLINAENVNNLNYRVGEKLIFDDDVEITTPTKNLKESKISFNEIGKHTIKGRNVYVNLLSPKESNINHVLDSQTNGAYESDIVGTDVKKRMITYLIYAALAILFLELLYIKIRGDL
ncbi:MAG: BatA domain-containing protein [Candidatus Woesearchaeota archaeon]